ncbi:MAG: HAD-IIB family hydrolase [Bryobacteraceae bacterium]
MVLFTDLDGTLLDHDTYEWAPARPAIELLREKGIPWIIVTSKTRAEVDLWRAELGHTHPYIVENGGAIYIPGEAPVRYGASYAELTEALELAARESGCAVRGFARMTVDDVVAATGLPREAAALAKVREHDEAFEVLTPERQEALVAAIRAMGFHLTRGGRFWHIIGDNDKARAVAELQRRYGGESIGLGDGPNDAAFLNRMDHPVIVRSKHEAEMRRLVPRGVVTAEAGPRGWNEAVLRLCGGIDADRDETVQRARGEQK